MRAVEGRTPLSYMHVTFPADDQLGEVFAWISMVPLCFFMVQAAMVISNGQTKNQKIRAVLILLGQLINEVLNYVLKDVYQELRPNVTERFDYGMPSSHAQFMGFLLGIFHHLLPFTIFDHLPRVLTYILAIIGSAIVCYSRLYLGYHSERQVAVGFFLGLTLGSLWSYVIDSASSDSEKFKKQ